MARILFLLAAAFGSIAAASSGGSGVVDDKTLSRAETEVLAARDLAARLKADESDIAVVKATEREWPDSTLGCGRKGLVEPRPVPGFEITLGYDGRSFVYHADRRGRVLRCDKPAKPIGPINR